MISDKKLCDKLLKSFPEITAKQRDEIENTHLSHYLIYHRVKSNLYAVYCTKCRKHYELSYGMSHNREYDCQLCKHNCTALSAGISRESRSVVLNFAVFLYRHNRLYIRCFIVTQEFAKKFNYRNDASDYDNGLRYDYNEKYLYCFCKDGVQKWRHRRWFSRYEKEYTALKSELEPQFKQNSPWNTSRNNNEYFTIGKDALNKTLLKYADCAGRFTPSRYIEYLCEFWKYPNIEYLYKTGFGHLITDKIDYGNMCGFRINYKTDNVKKMLGFDKVEMELLRGRPTWILSSYKAFRPHLPGESAQGILAVAEKHHNNQNHMTKAAKMTGLSVCELLNYCERQASKKFSWQDYIDYLEQCVALKYDLTKSLHNRPKDMQKEHRKLSKLIQYKADEEMRRRIAERNKKLDKYFFDCDELGLIAILPESPDEIINEGKSLSHCVGGYAQRHVDGKLTIILVRQKNSPGKSFFTMEISKDGKINQCRGKSNKNYTTNDNVELFVERYQNHLNTIHKKKTRKRVRVSA
jgi:hypothetical protein